MERSAVTYLCKRVATINSDIRLLEKMYEQVLREAQGRVASNEDVNRLFTVEDCHRVLLENYDDVLLLLDRA